MLPKVIENEAAVLRFKTKDGKVCPYLVADTPLAKRLSGLTQIMHDLENAKELINLIETVDNSEIKYSLWMSAVVTYGKCFASANGRKSKLELEHVKRFNPEALNFHNLLIGLRNEYFAHAGRNDYEKSNVCIILAPEENGREVLWANHVMVKKSNILSDETTMFCALCDGLYDVVNKTAEDIHSRVLKEYEEMNLDELYNKALKQTHEA